MADRGYVTSGKSIISHNKRYVVAQPGQSCGCRCCDEWYVFPRDRTTDIHWLTNVDELCVPQSFEDCSPECEYCYNDLYPSFIAICADSFKPRRLEIGGVTGMSLWANEEFRLPNSPDVRFFENFVYPEEGPDGRGVCGMSNVLPGEQGGHWRGPVFYHVPWYFQVNFSTSTWPMYNGWPRAIYKGTLTDSAIKTTDEILAWNNNPAYAREQIEFVYREPSTGEHNCDSVDCSTFHIYKREFDIGGVVGAKLELEAHWGCRPLLCTGDYAYHIYSQDPTTTYLYHLNASHVPCSQGCTQAISPSPDDDFTYYMPHEVSCRMGSFGGVSPSILESFFYNDETGQVSWTDDGEDPIKHPNRGRLDLLGRITYSLVDLVDAVVFDQHGACPYKIVSTWLQNEVAYWDTPVPDYSDPIYLDPEAAIGGDAHHYLSYFTSNSRPGQRCGCLAPNCVKESNPVSEGVYQLDPVPFIAYAGLRMFVDLVPQVGDQVAPFSVYLDYLEDKSKAQEFIDEHSERVVTDSAGNQYLVSVPYSVDLSSGGKPNYPEMKGRFPKLHAVLPNSVPFEMLEQLIVEFEIVCMNDIQSEICGTRLNAVLMPMAGLTETSKSIVSSSGLDFTVNASIVYDRITVEVEVPYGQSRRTFSKTVRFECFEESGCTIQDLESESLNHLSLNISSIAYQA